jgi:undecaprenyl-phosphate 4-deoxy-4-formamido-L-arabinose transferase
VESNTAEPAPRTAAVPSISVVVPVFNGEATIATLVHRSRAVLEELGGPWEIVLVNDGSEDRSWETITSLAAEDRRVRGIELLRNYGQHSALLAGIRAASGEVIVTIDDDLQNPPEEMPKLLEELEEGRFDVVYGVPIEKQHGRLRNFAARLVARAILRIGGDSAAMVSAYRAFRADLRIAFADYRGPDVSIDGLLTWGTERFGSVEVRHEPRAAGSSNYGFFKLLGHALTSITAFSTKPLRFATMVGFAATVLGMILLGYVLVRYFAEGAKVPGFAFLASLISVLAGAQLFTIGVIGEYLARVHVRVMERPSYTIRSEAPGREAEDRNDG